MSRAVGLTKENLRARQSLINDFIEKVSTVVLGKEHEIKLLLACLLAEGHILIEDIPGVGKTTVVKTIAKLMQLASSRIQMTNDLLPADIIGTSIFDKSQSQFVFHKGPLFSQIVLIDELNRATPKTQSACLQAMEERKITVDLETFNLHRPFFVIATQNPQQQIGTYPLPESQLDRFLMRIELGYPSREAEKKILQGESRDKILEDLQPVLSAQILSEMQLEVKSVFMSDLVTDYIQDIIDKTRHSMNLMSGLSPRAGTHLVQASRAWAYLQGRSMILPEDVQAIAVSVMSHRLNPKNEGQNISGSTLAKTLIQSLPVPS